MNTGYYTPAYGGGRLGYQTVETLLDDVSRQMASSNATKYSRGASGQRGSGGSMRIVKPSSTNNSPRGSIGLGRRRTVMTDRRRIAMADPNMSTTGFISNDGLQIPTRSNRPVSWHPTSQMVPQLPFYEAYTVPTMQTQQDLHLFDLPPTPAVYSGYGSPDSTFSPLSMPYTGYEQNYPYADSAVPFQSNQGYASNHLAAQSIMPYSSTQSNNAESGMHTHFDWNNIATNGFESSTAPPTPEFFLPIQDPENTLPADDAIPYHSLSDSEPEGEILQGLGLYDTPEIVKPYPSAPHFDNYRALVMSQFLGSAYSGRKSEHEPTGKGLKLEETWNPPPSDDEDDEGGDQDGEGEDDDEPIVHDSKDDSTQKSNEFVDASLIPNGIGANQGLHASWL